MRFTQEEKVLSSATLFLTGYNSATVLTST
jgi:hypothetical protein